MDKPAEPRDAAWLQHLVSMLLEQASNTSPPDHQACAKYAEILFKMLGRKQPKPQDLSWLQDAQRSADGHEPV